MGTLERKKLDKRAQRWVDKQGKQQRNGGEVKKKGASIKPKITCFLEKNPLESAKPSEGGGQSWLKRKKSKEC